MADDKLLNVRMRRSELQELRTMIKTYKASLLDLRNEVSSDGFLRDELLDAEEARIERMIDRLSNVEVLEVAHEFHSK